MLYFEIITLEMARSKLGSEKFNKKYYHVLEYLTFTFWKKLKPQCFEDNYC